MTINFKLIKPYFINIKLFAILSQISQKQNLIKTFLRTSRSHNNLYNTIINTSKLNLEKKTTK